jgi:dTDP-4-amino-4,6-dideoxygalactose transaminase
MIQPWPTFTQDEVEAATAVLRSGRVSAWTGEECRQFEAEFAARCGTRYAVAVANGTLALELALRALGIGAGDQVVVTPRSFIASASCVVAAGATPVFADVDPVTQNITRETVEPVLNPRVRAVICVHLAGWPCAMDAMMEMAAAHRLSLIEDCAQAHGAAHRGRPVGSLGHVAAFSFCQDKIITTAGEGGMLVTNDPAIWARAWSYKDHGKDWDAVHHRSHPPGFRWLHDSFGSNWRLTEIQAAVGRVQLRKLEEWSAARRRNAAVLDCVLADIPAVRLTIPDSDIRHAYYKYYAFVRPERLRVGWDRDRIMAAINAAGVPCYAGSCSEMYLEKAFDRTAHRPVPRLPVARQLGETSLMFLVDPTWNGDRMDSAAATIRQVVLAAGH